jgi:class 3 adenylate cyclase
MPDVASQMLPPYRGILAVDTERFTRNPSAHQPDLSAAVQEVLRGALERCGHLQIWQQRRFPEGTGDGYMFGVLPEMLPFLLSPFLGALHETLAEKDDSLRAINRGTRLRLRVSVNVGPVPDSGDEMRDRIGDPMNTTFRLLDSSPVRNALKESNPDVTLMAVIVSQRVFDDVIRAGYTPALHPDQLMQVTAEVPGKDFAEPAWVYVPHPSRVTSRNDKDTPAESPGRPGRQGAPFYKNTGQQIITEQVHGDITYRGTSS